MTGPELRAQQAHAEEIATPCGLCGAGIRDKANKVLLDASNITAKGMAKTLAQHQREEHRGQGQAFMDVMRHHNAHLCTYGLCTTCGDLTSSLFHKGTTCSRCVKAQQVAEAQGQPPADADSVGTGQYAAIMRRVQQIPDFEAQRQAKRRQAKRAANEAAAATTAQAAAAAAAVTAQAAAAAQQQAAAGCSSTATGCSCTATGRGRGRGRGTTGPPSRDGSTGPRSSATTDRRGRGYRTETPRPEDCISGSVETREKAGRNRPHSSSTRQQTRMDSSDTSSGSCIRLSDE